MGASLAAGGGGGGGGGGGRFSFSPPHAKTSAATGSVGRAKRANERSVLAFMGGREHPPAASTTQPGSSVMPHRQRYLFVCINRRPDGHPKGSCAEKGSEAIVPALKAALDKRGVAKVVARACSASCLDLCETGVSVVLEPEHVAYGGVTMADVDEIADATARGEVVDRLVVQGLEEYKKRRGGAA
jgi:(2Fe-2S) ferredoxin